MVELLREHGFWSVGDLWVFDEGIYRIVYSSKQTKGQANILNSCEITLCIENKDGEYVELGKIEGKESLITVLNLIKWKN